MGTAPEAAPLGTGYPWHVPGPFRIRFLVLGVALAVAGCSTSGAVASFDPSGPCTADGQAPGAYPDLEALVPKTYQSVPPVTLNSGRNCSSANLGSLAKLGITEVRFAGGTWSFGAERAAVLAVFRASGLTADAQATFYEESAAAASRTQILAQSKQTIAGRQGWRIDTQTSDRMQTVVVWPAAEPDTVDVVITNALPDARIKDALDAFGGR
jgi:hypothetical protein